MGRAGSQYQVYLLRFKKFHDWSCLLSKGSLLKHKTFYFRNLTAEAVTMTVTETKLQRAHKSIFRSPTAVQFSQRSFSRPPFIDVSFYYHTHHLSSHFHHSHSPEPLTPNRLEPIRCQFSYALCRHVDNGNAIFVDYQAAWCNGEGVFGVAAN